MDAREYLYAFLAGKTSQRSAAFPIAKTSFAAFRYGNRWVDTVSYAECVRALSECGVIPSVIIGEKEYFSAGHRLAFDFREIRREGENRILETSIETRAGMMRFEETVVPCQMPVMTKNILSDSQGLIKLSAYLDDVRECAADIVPRLKAVRNEITKGCALQFFLPQPFEVYCLAGREEAIYLQCDEDEQFAKVKEKILETDLCLMEKAAASGEVDFFLFGSAGTELYSPQMFDEEFMESSRIIIAKAKELRIPIIYHACGNMRYLFEQSRILELEPDVFEGMAFSPVGDLEPEHWKMLPDSIVVRGNLDLALLRDGSADQVRNAAERLLETFPGKRILLSGCCDTLYGTPDENIKALKIGDRV